MTIADLVAKRPITSLAVLLGMVAAVAPFLCRRNRQGLLAGFQTENCSSAAVCIVDFSAVPASKQVTITSVSCAIVVNGPPLIRDIKLGSKNGNGNQQTNFTFLTPTQNGASGSFTYYSINNSSVHILRAGETANITVTFNTAPTGEAVKCTLGGFIEG